MRGQTPCISKGSDPSQPFTDLRAEREQRAQTTLAQIQAAPNHEGDVDREERVSRERAPDPHVRRDGTTKVSGQQERAEYREAVKAGTTPGHAAIALGVTASALAIPAGSALLAFCHSHTVGILGAALRLIPFTHSQSQAILHRLHPTITREVRRIRRRHWRNIASFAPELDLVALGHETDDLRQFAS